MGKNLVSCFLTHSARRNNYFWSVIERFKIGIQLTVLQLHMQLS